MIFVDKKFSFLYNGFPCEFCKRYSLKECLNLILYKYDVIQKCCGLLMAKLKPFTDKCAKCGVAVENPQARNDKREPLCCHCWELAEEDRRVIVQEAAK